MIVTKKLIERFYNLLGYLLDHHDLLWRSRDDGLERLFISMRARLNQVQDDSSAAPRMVTQLTRFVP